MDKFPSQYYRGLTQKDAVSEEGYATSLAFQFDKFEDREDGFKELSINWNDDEGSLATLKQQHKPFKEGPQFKFGYVVVEKNIMDLIMRSHISDGSFSYERRPIEGNLEADISPNPYHGNLLLNNSLSKPLQKTIEGTLAGLASTVQPIE